MKKLLLIISFINLLIANPKYKDMVDRITKNLELSYKAYENSQISKAKDLVQNSYFEIFENLEGPIRINISANKAYLMEREFADIRKMIIKKQEKEKIKKRIDDLISTLYETLKDLDGGTIIEAQGLEKTKSIYPEKSTVHPKWVIAIKHIRKSLYKALEKYKNDKNLEEVIELIQDAKFNGYKNTQFEIAMKRYQSFKIDFEIQDSFVLIIKDLKKNIKPDDLEIKIDELLELIYENAIDIPYVNEKHSMSHIKSSKDGKFVMMQHNLKNSKNTKSKNLNINPTWEKAITYIKNNFRRSIEAYGKNNKEESIKFIQNAQYEGYRNTMFEVAIKRNISFKIDFLIQNEFNNIIKDIKENNNKNKIEKKLNELINILEKSANNLPLIKEVEQKKEKKKKDYSIVVENLFKEIQKSFDIYKNQDTKKAISLIQDSYFDIFEASGMETAIGIIDPNYKVKLEGFFNKIVALMKANSNNEKIQEELVLMHKEFKKSLKLLNTKKEDLLSSFLYSLLIIIREGFEALLIIIAIMTYLIKSGNSNKLSIVYSSFFTAIILSFITAFLINYLFTSTAGLYRELLEGITMFVASALLLYVSYWLVSNAEAKKWNNYIKEKVHESLNKNSIITLWMTVFLAVYREGAETVIFYQALIIDIGSNNDLIAILGGFLTGIFILAIVYFMMKTTAMKLAIKPYFLVTSIMVYFLSFTFAGKGIIELIEAGVLIPTLIESFKISIPFMGIYPYLESLLAQAIILLFGGLGILKIRSKKKNLS